MEQIINKQFSHVTNQLVNQPMTYYALVESNSQKELQVFNNLTFDKQKALFSFGENSKALLPHIEEISADSYQHLSLVFIPNENKEEALNALENTLDKWTKGQDQYFDYFEYGVIVLGLKETPKGLIVMVADQAVFSAPIQDRDNFFGANFELHNVDQINKDYDGSVAAYLTIEECDLDNSTKETFWEDLIDREGNSTFINFCKEQFLSPIHTNKVKFK